MCTCVCGFENPKRGSIDNVLKTKSEWGWVGWQYLFEVNIIGSLREIERCTFHILYMSAHCLMNKPFSAFTEMWWLSGTPVLSSPVLEENVAFWFLRVVSLFLFMQRNEPNRAIRFHLRRIWWDLWFELNFAMWSYTELLWIDRRQSIVQILLFIDRETCR